MTFKVFKPSKRGSISKFMKCALPQVRFVKHGMVSFNLAAMELVVPAEAFVILFDEGTNVVAFKEARVGDENSFKFILAQNRRRIHMTRDFRKFVGEDRYSRVYSLVDVQDEELGRIFVVDLEEGEEVIE